MERSVTSLCAVPNQRTLAGWRLHWIHDETAVHCPVCLASQSILAAREPFVHQPNCSRAHPQFADYPWQDLARILQKEMFQALKQGQCQR